MSGLGSEHNVWLLSRSSEKAALLRLGGTALQLADTDGEVIEHWGGRPLSADPTPTPLMGGADPQDHDT